MPAKPQRAKKRGLFSMTDDVGTLPSPPVLRSVLALAWPMTLKAIMLHGVVVIDALLVAQLGEETLAAMGLAAAIAGLALGVIFAFSTAMQIRVAQAHGSGQAVRIKSAFACGMTINLLATALCLVLGILFAGPIIEAFAQTETIAQDALSYLMVFSVALLAEAFGQGLTSQFNGSGDARTPFYGYLISLPINVGLSILLIHGHWGLPELGLTGAAVGTAVAAVVRGLFLGLRIHHGVAAFAKAPGWAGDKFTTAMTRNLTFAMPIAATFISSTAGLSVCRLFYARLDINEFAAMTLIMPWVQVAGTIGMSWAQATGLIVAQLLGSKSPVEVLDAFLAKAWRAAFVAAALVSLAYVVVCLASTRLYSDLQSETLAALLAFLPILVILPFPKQSNAICGNTLRAGGETVYVMKVFVVSQWMFTIPLTALFVFQLELSVVWVFSLLLIEELVKFPAFHKRLFAGKWKTAEVEDM